MKHPYCLVYRVVGNRTVPVWQLIDNGDSFLNKRGDKVSVYSVEAIENETLTIVDEKTKEQFVLTSDHDCRSFNVYWKSNEDFEKV